MNDGVSITEEEKG